MNLRYQTFFHIVFLLLVATTTSMQPALAAGSTRLEATGSLGTKAILELQQAPLVVMKPLRFTLHTTPVLPETLVVGDIFCDLTMPAMPMPPNHPKVQRQGGAFSGEMIFTMAGAWQAEFRFPFPDGKEERFSFTIDQVLLK